MAEDLDFPPGPDDLSFVDFGTNLLSDDLRNDINPLIPNQEFHIPQIYAHSNSGGQQHQRHQQQLLLQQQQQQRNIATLVPNNAVNNINTMNNSSYQPINQLMKQTQELAMTLDRPLNSNPNLTFNNQMESNLNQQSLLTNNIQSQQPGQLTSSQYLVVGGQRIQIPVPQHQRQQQQQQQNIQKAQLFSQQPLVGSREAISLVNNISHSANSLSSSSNLSFNPINMNSVMKSSSQHPHSSVGLHHVASPQSALNMQNMNTHSVMSKLPVTQPTVGMNSPANSPKQSVVVKLPTQQPPASAPQKVKQPFKGSIIKTADQQLMFVTEVNGKKVGYVIQQSKIPATVPQQVNACASVPLSANVPSPGVPSPRAPSPVVPSPNVPSPISIPSPTIPPSPSNMSPEIQVLSTHKTRISSIQDIDISKLKHIGGSVTSSINNVSPMQHVDISTVTPKEELGVNPKCDEVAFRSIRERLQGLGNSLKNPVKTNMLPSISKSMNEGLLPNNAFVPTGLVQQVNPVSEIISDFDHALPSDSDDDMKTPIEYVGHDGDVTSPPSIEDGMKYEEEEEEAQELEFSENDVTADVNDDSDEPLITAIRMTRDKEELTDFDKQTLDEEEESDSLPLAMLKHDGFNEDIPIVCEKTTPEKVTKPRKYQRKTSTNDSLPLSVVAASLKKSDQVDGSAPVKKKRGRKKKKRDDAPVKPIFAYQLFFREVSHELREQNPVYKENFGELSKKIGHLWEILEPEKKKVYQDSYLQAKEEYTKKLAEYNEQKAKEVEQVLSPAMVGDENSRDGDDDENAPLKKSAKKKVTPKKTNMRKKLMATTVATRNTVSLPLDDTNQEEYVVFNPEPSAKQTANIIDGPSTTKGRKTRSKKVSTTDSPSPPSSDTNTSDEEDDEDDHISRIRLLAARASEQLRKIEKKSAKGKTKEVASAKRGGRVTKMEVETVSEKVVMEHAPLPDLDVKPPLITTAAEPMDISEKEPTPPKSPSKIESPFASPSQTSVASSSSKATSKAVNSKSKERGAKLTKTKSDKSREDPRAKPTANQLGEHVKDKQKKNDEMITQPVPKTSFKIPKRTHGENGQAIPQGPRLCIRGECENPIKATRERGAQYCSNECLVLYCRNVFDTWVIERQSEAT